MQMLNLNRFLPIISMGDDVFRCCDTAPHSRFIVEREKSGSVPGRSLDLYYMRRNFLDNLIPVHLVTPCDKPNAKDLIRSVALRDTGRKLPRRLPQSA